MGVNIVKLKDVVDILNGYAFKSSKYVKSGHRVMRITNVQKGILVDDDPKYYEQSNELNKYELKIGDILISLTGNVGRVGMVEEQILPAYLNQRVGCLRIKSDKVFDRYLFHLLNNDSFEDNCIRNSNGIAQLNMSTEWLKDVDINLPPLEEQKKIARILDKADEIRTKKRLANAKLDEFLKSTFISMFGDPKTNNHDWNTRKLTEMCEISSTTVMPNTQDYCNMLHIGGANIESNTGKLINLKTAKEEGLTSIKFLIHPDHVLFSKIRPKLRKVAMPKMNALCSADIYPLLPIKDKCVKEYLLYLLRTEYFSRIVSDMAESRSNIPKVNREELSQIFLMCPPIEEQNKFAQIVEKVEAQKQKNEQVIEQMDNLFNSLSQNAFKGLL